MWLPSMRTSAFTLLVLVTTIAIGVAPRSTHAAQGETGREQATAQRSGLDVRGVHFVVLVWYRQDDPLGTFQSQSYDVRKGEYTGAVDDWLKLMREKHPRYVVRVLKVDLAREKGATEKLKVGSVIHRELLFAAAQAGVVLGAPLQISQGPSTSQSQTPRVNRMPARPLPDRSFLDVSPTPSIPVYPRTRAP
jgi:hypothetical protein